jgi:hypothetical protein
MLDELPPARVRAGWTLPAALAGLVAALLGGWLVHSVAQAYMACDLFGALEGIPGVEHTPLSCGGVSLRYHAGGVLGASGVLLALVALLVAARRGRAAAREGHPWPLRRFLTRLAVAADRRLPGASGDRAPRVSATVVGALLSCIVLASLITIHAAWSDHQREVEIAHRHAAERALTRLALPMGVTRGTASGAGCSPSAVTLCASSPRSADDLRSDMESLLKGRTSKLMCDLLTQPKGVPCPVTIYGTIDGYPAVAIVFQHLLIVRKGQPPIGAVPLHAGKPRGIFFLGADINVSLIVSDS